MTMPTSSAIIPILYKPSSKRRGPSTVRMNMDDTTSINHSSPFDSQTSIGFGTIQDNNLITMTVPESTIQHETQLSRSFTAPSSQGVSIIHNSLAQSFTMKRARAMATILSPLIKSKSESNMLRHSSKFTYKNRTTGSGNTVKIISQGSTPRNSCPDLSGDDNDMSIEDMCPYTYIENVLIDENDEQPVKEEQTKPLHEAEFITPTEEQIAAYSNDAIAAVRTSDVNALREIYAKGQTLRCCNRFGESLLHLACRRSNADVVSFLLNEADVSPRIKDDYGRTPLHDACWRGNPEYEIVELLLSVEPKLAFVQDVRGHKPFQYARKEHWGAWREFLDQKRELILS